MKVPHEPIMQAWGRTKRLRGRDRDRPQLPTEEEWQSIAARDP
jgi:hypothetical protein